MPEDNPHSARRLLTLLWRHSLPGKPVARGPKPGVSVDQVVAAAVALADREGYEKVSIRAIAAELGLRPMSVYTYVPSKEALTVLMVDAVAERDEPIDAGAPVRERMTAIADGVRAEILAHPWLLEVPPWRLVLGPGRMRRYERQLAAIDGIGLSDVEMDRVIAVLTDFAIGNARLAVAGTRETGEVSDAQWWAEVGPELDRVMPVQEFPLASRVGAAVGELHQAPADPDGAYAFGLVKLIEGILADLANVAADLANVAADPANVAADPADVAAADPASGVADLADGAADVANEAAAPADGVAELPDGAPPAAGP